MERVPLRPDIAALITPLTIDDLSTIRYVHAQALRSAAADWAGPDDLAAIDAYVYAPRYSAGLENAVIGGNLGGAYVGPQLAGTCGWSVVPDDRQMAHIRWCHVLPLFAGIGIGRALLTSAENAAARAGRTVLSARASPDAARFFEQAGFGITSHGVRTMQNGRRFPIVYLRKCLGPTIVQPLF